MKKLLPLILTALFVLPVLADHEPRAIRNRRRVAPPEEPAVVKVVKIVKKLLFRIGTNDDYPGTPTP